MIEPILSGFGRTAFAQDLLSRIPAAGRVLRLAGLPGSSGAVMVAWLAERLSQRLFTVVAATPAEAERWLADLAILTDQPVALYPQREALGEEGAHVGLGQQQHAQRRAQEQGGPRLVAVEP